MWLIHIAVQQKPVQRCKATILQLKINLKCFKKNMQMCSCPNVLEPSKATLPAPYSLVPLLLLELSPVMGDWLQSLRAGTACGPPPLPPSFVDQASSWLFIHWDQVQPLSEVISSPTSDVLPTYLSVIPAHFTKVSSHAVLL